MSITNKCSIYNKLTLYHQRTQILVHNKKFYGKFIQSANFTLRNSGTVAKKVKLVTI